MELLDFSSNVIGCWVGADTEVIVHEAANERDGEARLRFKFEAKQNGPAHTLGAE